MEELHLERQLAVTPQRLLRLEADVADLVVAQLGEFARQLALRTLVGLGREILGAGGDVVEVESEGRQRAEQESACEESSQGGGRPWRHRLGFPGEEAK